MSVRTFTHALTGRSLQVRKDSRTERLVEADDNWSEVKQSKSTSKKEASDGSGNAGGRGGSSRKGRNANRGDEAAKPAE